MKGKTVMSSSRNEPDVDRKRSERNVKKAEAKRESGERKAEKKSKDGKR